MPKLTQKGFAVLEAVLIFVIVGILGGTGYYVYNSNKTSNDTLNKAGSSAQSTVVRKKKADPTAKWIAYTSEKGKFSVKYPPTWVQPPNQEYCGDFLKTDLEIGPDSKSVVKCGGDGQSSQVSIAFYEGDLRNDPVVKFQSTGWENIKTETITVDGQKGARVSATAANQPQLLGSFPDETVIVRDIFYVNGNTYSANYIQVPKAESGPTQNQLDTYKLILSTLKFE
jgi:hypothetical protein